METRDLDSNHMGEGHGRSGGDESRLNEAVEEVNDGPGGVVAPPVHQPPPGPNIRWERFLPLGSLKVLLVENDDSTRQVVSALLRNCSYEVTVAANGLQAWKILGDLTNHVDLVLTEVVMPCLSGFGLLCKIMSHKTRKNIPVIMMSSNDSMGTVFKCLSKGAVDFLVKPIRKNELKNLWQHVWRRCHSSSGSGSESGIHAKKSAESKSDDDSDNNTGSNDEDDNGSTGLNVRDGSDNGSGTQSSWTKRAVEAESSQSMSLSDQLADPHDSTCAQVILSKTEIFFNEWAPQSTTRECQEQKESADKDFMGKDLDIGVPTNPDMPHESYATEKVYSNLTRPSVDKPKTDLIKDIHDGILELENSNVVGKPGGTQADSLIGGIAHSCDAKLVVRATEVPNCFSKMSERREKTTDKFKEVPSPELSLQRSRSTEEGRIAMNDDRNVLRHSDLSAFSRYNTSASTQAPTGYGGTCSLPLDNSSETVKMESMYNVISNSYAAPLKQGSNSSSNNNDMGSTAKNVSTKPAAFMEKLASASASTVRGIHPSDFHPMQHGTSTQQVVQETIVDVATAAAVGPPRGIQHQAQIQHHHHHYHHHHYHVHSTRQQLQPLPDQCESSLKSMAAAAPQCGSSNVFVRPTEGNAANYSLNGSNSGSNHGGNVQNGSSVAAIGGAMNTESDNGNAKNGVGSGNMSSNAEDQNWLTQREAALNKFRQKRKERNFEKKVRYQSRKRLAEQRPRVRGQFVRHAVSEHTSQETDSQLKPQRSGGLGTIKCEQLGT